MNRSLSASIPIQQAHQLYEQLTGQCLSLRYDRERMWYDWLRAGHTLQDLRRVIVYLQGEIRAGRRNVGALKLCNLLQLDRFEEDLQISQVRLKPLPPRKVKPPPPPPLSSRERERRRQDTLQRLRQLKASLR